LRIHNCFLIFLITVVQSVASGSEKNISPGSETFSYSLQPKAKSYSFSLLTDSKDSLKAKPNRFKDPKRAGTLSALVPGAGQIYNGKYWKAPLFWGALGGVGYMIHFNNRQAKDFRSAILMRTDDNPDTVDPYIDLYTTDNLVSLQDQARRNRDLFIILFSVGYLIQVVDAVVDAHLSTFDVSEDLSIRIRPGLQYANNYVPSVTATIKFRK
jgi:hypothetical protein